MLLFSLLANGFLPTRGSFMLDFVFVAMFAVSAVMIASILLVRLRKQYQLHRSIQTALAIVLAVTVALFEIDVRFMIDWRELARPSAFYESGLVDWALWVHLAFAIPTPLVWGYVVVQALRKFPKPAHPGVHSRAHRFWGRIAAGLMLMTAITGCCFYWLAFVE